MCVDTKGWKYETRRICIDDRDIPGRLVCASVWNLSETTNGKRGENVTTKRLTDQQYRRALLRAVGLKKHGKHWKVRLSEDLERDRSTITYWDQGKNPIDRLVERELERMARTLGIKKSDIVA